MEGLEQGAPPEPRAGRGRRARGVQATDAHTTLRPALRVVVVVVLVTRLLTVVTDNGRRPPPSTARGETGAQTGTAGLEMAYLQPLDWWLQLSGGSAAARSS